MPSTRRHLDKPPVRIVVKRRHVAERGIAFLQIVDPVVGLEPGVVSPLARAKAARMLVQAFLGIRLWKTDSFGNSIALVGAQARSS